MSIVNRSPLLATCGVWNTGMVLSGASHSRGPGRTMVFAVGGWIPGVCIIAGIVNIFAGVMLEVSEKDDRLGRMGVALIGRGVVQLFQLGFVFAPVDIGCSVARSVQDARDYARYTQTT